MLLVKVCVELMTLFVFSSGCILRLPIWGDSADDNCFDDEPYWEVRNETIKRIQLHKKKVTLNHK